MTKIYFIFVLTILLIFSVYNAGFEKHHDNKSVLDERQVKNTFEKATTIDGVVRIIADLSVIGA